MKNAPEKPYSPLFVFFGLLLLFGGNAAYAVSLNIVPATQNAGIGDMLEVGVEITGLGDFMPDSLGTYDFDVTFDTGVLEVVDVVFGDPVLGNQLDLFGFGLNPAGFSVIGNTLNVFEVSLDFASDLNSLQAGSFQLATIVFNAKAAGTSPLDLSDILLGDAFAAPLMATAAGGSATVVPVPAALYLFGSGLLGLIGLARQKAARQNTTWRL